MASPPLALKKLLAAILTLLCLGHVGSAVVGPDLKPRTRLLRDLHLGSGGLRADDDGDGGGRRTLINMSLAVRELELTKIYT